MDIWFAFKLTTVKEKAHTTLLSVYNNAGRKIRKDVQKDPCYQKLSNMSSVTFLQVLMSYRTPCTCKLYSINWSLVISL